MNQSTSTDRLAWFKDAKLGLFAHWGVYSVIGRGEWVFNRERMSWEAYRKAAENFTAHRFDANTFVQAVKDADAKYLVLTAKHHDGFCLWDTATTDWNCMQIGAKRDILGQLCEACHANDIKIGIFYSMADWSHPGYPTAYATDWPKAWASDEARQSLVDYAKKQIWELTEKYPIDIWWFDGAAPGMSAEEWDADEIIDHLREVNPLALINNRLFRPGDFDALEWHLNYPKDGTIWETDYPMNDNWAWTPHDTAYQTPLHLWKRLLWSNQRGGNMLLNIAPGPDGELRADERATLKLIGDHLKTTRDLDTGVLNEKIPWVQFGDISAKQGALYLHVYSRDEDELVYCGIKNKIKAANLVAPEKRLLSFKQAEDRIVISGLTGARKGPLGYIVELQFDGEVEPLLDGHEDLQF